MVSYILAHTLEISDIFSTKISRLKEMTKQIFSTMEAAISPLRLCIISIALMTIFLLRTLSAEAGTFYTYINEKGTMVVTQTLEEIPPDFRKQAEKIVFKETHADKTTQVKEIFNQIKNKGIGAKKIFQRGKPLSSLFQDQRIFLAAILIGIIPAYLVFAAVLKRFVGNFMARIVMKLIIIVCFFSGFYLFYLSWMSKNILDFDQASSGTASSREKTLSEQITTPSEILERARDVVNQLNDRTKLQEKALRDAGVEVGPNP